MLSLFKNHKVLFVLSLFLSTLCAALTIAAAFVLEKVLNAVVEGDWALFNTMIWVVVGFIVIAVLLTTSAAIIEKKLIVNTVRDIRSGLYRGILSRDTEQFRTVNTADYLSALTNDIKIIEETLLVPFLQVIQYAIVFVMAAVALFYYSPIIGGIMIVCLALMYLLPSSLGKPIGTCQEAYSKGLALFTIHLKDQFAGYEVIRSFRLGNQVRESFSTQNTSLANRKFSVDRLIACSEGIASTIGMGTQLGVMLVVGFLVLNGQMAAGALLAILQLSGSFVQPVGVIMQSIPVIQGALPVLNRIKELSQRLPSAFKGTAEPTLEENIRFEDVNFSYSEERPVLINLDASFEKGGKYAIVGGSGCGKSTIIRLLGAEYSSYTGAISLDNNELHELDIDKLLTLMSVIHQNVYMFDESIKDNISLHRQYSDTEWERALRLSGVDRFLDQTENGLDTPVGENGVNLSGGQRQRVAVARALIENKPLLILDEGTSAMDAKTSFDIESALLEIDELTMITITHNLSPELLRRYDAVLYMEQGRIAEAGSYDQLVSKQGKFEAFRSVGTETAEEE